MQLGVGLEKVWAGLVMVREDFHKGVIFMSHFSDIKCPWHRVYGNKKKETIRGRKIMQELSIYLDRCSALHFINSFYKHLANLCLQGFDCSGYSISTHLTPQSFSTWVFFSGKVFHTV